MKIGIDARILEKRISGIRRYTEGILSGLDKIEKDKNYYFLFCLNGFNINFRLKKFKIVPTFKNTCIPLKIYSFSPLWLNFVCRRQLEKYKIDICIFPAHFCPLWRTKTKYLIVIHDMAHKIEKTAKGFFRKIYINRYLKQSIKRSSGIITVSESSKKDILNFYPYFPSSRIFVIPEAAEEKFSPKIISKEISKKLQKKYKLKENIILYVGKIEERKNILAILRIADIIFSKREDIQFLLIGDKGYKSYRRLKKEINKRKEKNVNHIEYVDDDELIDIYNLAKVFLFPSFYEGFGLPVLEAMQCGLPVLTSNTSSLPEVVGKGGIMHNPKDYKKFADDIIKIVDDNGFRRELSQKAIWQARKFSWKKSAENLIKVIDSIKDNI